jgi:hypothetical protein
MDPKGKGKVTDKKENEKEIPSTKTPKGETIDSWFGKKKKDKKKKKKHIKKIVYYDSDASSYSPREDDDLSSTKKKSVKQNYSKTSFNYSRIPYDLNAHLLFVLGKPLRFDWEDYSWRSHKMRNHLFYLHPNIWDVFENGMQCIDNDDESFNAIHA